MEKHVFLTTKEVCDVFRSSRQTIFRWVQCGKLQPLDKSAKKWLFRRSDIEAIVGSPIVLPDEKI